MIENLAALINKRRNKPGTMRHISQEDIESAKAKVQSIIDSGELKRRKVKKRKKKEDD